LRKICSHNCTWSWNNTFWDTQRMYWVNYIFING
jgi:hypothetical protein